MKYEDRAGVRESDVIREGCTEVNLLGSESVSVGS